MGTGAIGRIPTAASSSLLPTGHVCPSPCRHHGSWEGKISCDPCRRHAGHLSASPPTAGAIPTFSAPAPPVQDAGDAQDVAQDKGGGRQIGALRKRHRLLFLARYPEPGSKFLSPKAAAAAGAQHRRGGPSRCLQKLPKLPACASASSWLRLWDVPGAGRVWGQPASSGRGQGDLGTREGGG